MFNLAKGIRCGDALLSRGRPGAKKLGGIAPQTGETNMPWRPVYHGAPYVWVTLMQRRYLFIGLTLLVATI